MGQENNNEVRRNNEKFFQTYKSAWDILKTFSEKDAVLYTLVDNMGTGDNIVSMTYKEISMASEVSFKTITRVMDCFEEVDIVRMIRRSKWMVNPKMFIKCNSEYRGKLCYDYFLIDKKNDKAHTNDSKDGD